MGDDRQINKHDKPLKEDVKMSETVLDDSSTENPLLDNLHAQQKSRNYKTYTPESTSRALRSLSSGNVPQDRLSLSAPSGTNRNVEKACALREKARQEKLSAMREKVGSKQSHSDFISSLNSDLEQLMENVDIDQLVEEERSALQDANEPPSEGEQLQLELEALLEDLSLS